MTSQHSPPSHGNQLENNGGLLILYSAIIVLSRRQHAEEKSSNWSTLTLFVLTTVRSLYVLIFDMTRTRHPHSLRPGGGVDPAAAGWQKRYTAYDIAAELIGCGHNIEATVFVECGTMFNGELDTPSEMRCVGETAYVNGVASQAASGAYGPAKFCSGIVATCDMKLEPAKVDAVLTAHAAASPNFRGIRAPYVLGGDANFAANMKLLEDKGLTYDLGAGADSLHEAIEVVRTRSTRSSLKL